MSSSFREKDRGWKNLVAMLPELDDAEVKVGIQSDAGADEEGTPLVMIGFYNEFGTNGRTPRRGGWGAPIPARPFLRDTSDKNKEEWGRVADRVVMSVIKGKTTLKRGLTGLGKLAEKDIKDGFTGGDWAPNSSMTVELKGSATPLMNIGMLRNTIRYVVNL